MQIDMFQDGQKPGPGSYKCKVCSEIAVLNDHEDELPYCQYCEDYLFILVDDDEAVPDEARSGLYVNKYAGVPLHRLHNDIFDWNL